MLAGSLGMLIPFVALVLVIAYAATGMSGGLRIFMGFIAVAMLASAVVQIIRVWFSVRLGAFGKTRRAVHPRRFWAWIGLSALMAAVHGAVSVFLLLFALSPALIDFR
ncbi:MAG TPA: hypothetical protein VGL66_16040 [Caulobacteraceae bacterium]|jgi:hypothetical protein